LVHDFLSRNDTAWNPLEAPLAAGDNAGPRGDFKCRAGSGQNTPESKKEAPLVEDTNCASWALKGRILKTM
ncbi:MAG: hypothetical protein AAEJ47_07070, partial [Planctomycetota bacterium]